MDSNKEKCKMTGKKQHLKRWPSWKQEPNLEGKKEQWPRFDIKQPQNSWKCFRTKPASLPLHLPVSGKHHCSTNYQNLATVINNRHVTSSSSSLLSFKIFGPYSSVILVCRMQQCHIMAKIINSLYIHYSY